MRVSTRSLLLLSVTLLSLAPLSLAADGPADLAGVPLLFFSEPTGSVRNHRLLFSWDGGVSWEPSGALPARVLPSDHAGEPLPVTSVAAHEGLVLVAVGNRLFSGRLAGRSIAWEEIDLTDVTNPASYITALAIDPTDPMRWVVGTSYDGIYWTADGGITWTDATANRSVEPLYQGAGFYQEVETLGFTPEGLLLIGAGFGGGFVTLDLESGRAVRLGPEPGLLGDGSPGSGDSIPPGSVIDVATGRRILGDLPDAPADGPGENPIETTAATQGGAERRSRASGRTGIYLAAANAGPEKLDGYFQYILSKGFDSVVVDFKDDFGRLTYDSELPLPRSIGAVRPLMDARELVEHARTSGIYLIARIVVFKDRELFAYDRNRLALWDRRRNAPYGVFRTFTDEETAEQRTVQVEHWVDPFSEEVWDYNIAIAREVVALGVDEVQFDYIRFPSDGRTEDIQERFRPDGADRVQALEGFLHRARGALEVPVGIDVYGFNAWASMNYIGQDITRLAAYVDVISPMFYPSHFARTFLPDLGYLDRAGVIYDLGTRRAKALAGPDTLIRPYIQAFLIGHELDFDEETYLDYLQRQLRAAEAGGADGYTLWNASGRYYMLP